VILSIPQAAAFLDFIGARSLWYIDEHGWVALSLLQQALSLLTI